jgi:hypothetical protein
VHFGFKREGTSGRKMRSCMSPRPDHIGRDCADDQHSLRCRICLLTGLQYTDGSCQSEVAKSLLSRRTSVELLLVGFESEAVCGQCHQAVGTRLCFVGGRAALEWVTTFIAPAW